MYATAATPAEGTVYGTPWDQIATTIHARRSAQSPLMRAMIEVRDRANGDWVLPDLPGMEGLAPAIIHDAIEHNAMAANQIRPNLHVPTINPGAVQGVTSRGNAELRVGILLATQQDSAWDLGRARWYRHYFGYGAASAMVRPDLRDECVRYVVRDPLSSYPEAKAPEDVSPLANIGFLTGKSAGWLRARYPQARQEQGGPIPAVIGTAAEELWDVLEWWDEEAMVIGILGPRWETRAALDPSVRAGRELYRAPNRAGMVPAAASFVVTLDRIASAVSATTGQVDLLARFTALDLIASEKAIFPDRYIVGSGPGVQPTLVNGKWVDGRSGEVNILVDTASVGEIRGTPDPSGKIGRDYLERGARMTAGLVAPQSGETYGALRTGRGIDTLMEAAVNPRMFEAHAVAAYAEQRLNAAALATYKGYFGAKTFSLYSSWAGDRELTFRPDKDLPVTTVTRLDGTKVEQLVTLNTVEYPFQGSDIQGATMWLGQALAARGISQATYRRQHPLIRDAEAEETNLLIEDLQSLVMEMLRMRAGPGGGLTPLDLANLLTLARRGELPENVLAEADRLASERQATMTPETPPEGMMANPEDMMGLALPGEGEEMAGPPPPAVSGPSDSQANLRRLMLALKTSPGMRV
jgi:hypothetical protein